jgi:hypothetical protein
MDALSKRPVQCRELRLRFVMRIVRRFSEISKFVPKDRAATGVIFVSVVATQESLQ